MFLSIKACKPILVVSQNKIMNLKINIICLLKSMKAMCVCVYTHFGTHAMTAVFCSESDPVNSSANFFPFIPDSAFTNRPCHILFISSWPFIYSTSPLFLYHILSGFHILLESIRAICTQTHSTEPKTTLVQACGAGSCNTFVFFFFLM